VHSAFDTLLTCAAAAGCGAPVSRHCELCAQHLAGALLWGCARGGEWVAARGYGAALARTQGAPWHVPCSGGTLVEVGACRVGELHARTHLCALRGAAMPGSSSTRAWAPWVRRWLAVLNVRSMRCKCTHASSNWIKRTSRRTPLVAPPLSS